MMTSSKRPEQYIKAIYQSGLSIYDSIEIGHPDLWIPTPVLEQLLNKSLSGLTLTGLPLRTRSKVVKQYICRSLGYTVPDTFTKTQPRFPGQMFDIYVQKSDNLQIWNEEVAIDRRYVIVRLDKESVIASVRVVEGDTLSLLDNTGTLTQKYQARLVPSREQAELITDKDTEIIRPIVRTDVDLSGSTPVGNPRSDQLLDIYNLFARLKPLVGQNFPDVGYDQERNRGAELHKLVCRNLGYLDYRDDGRFPDVQHQLLEVKLQTSKTIDLGLVCPDSETPLEIPRVEGQRIRHCDVRYALYYAHTDGTTVTLTNLYVTTGERFFTRFPRFHGKILNRKLQLHLPADFFRA